MSFRINTNTQAARSLTSLNRTSSEIGMRQLRLATGSKINSAGDDSAGFTISNKLTATTRGQAQALSNIGDAKSMLTVAEGALGSTMDILQTMKEKAIQAGNDTYGSEERAAIQTQLDALSSEIDDILGGAEFNGKKLFSGGDTLASGNTGTSLSFQVGAEAGQTFGVELDSIGTDSLAKRASVTGGGTGIAADIASSSFSGETDVTAGAGGPTFAVVAGTGTDAGKFKITYDADGTGTGSTATDVTGFQDSLAGVSAKGGDFSITFADDYVAAGGDAYQMGGDAAAAFSLDVSTAEGANDALAQIDGAISKINKAAGRIGDSQNRLDFKAQNLETSMTNYEAANSRIKDADFAKEQMEVVKLQILQQTGSAAFAQANRRPAVGPLVLLDRPDAGRGPRGGPRSWRNSQALALRPAGAPRAGGLGFFGRGGKGPPRPLDKPSEGPPRPALWVRPCLPSRPARMNPLRQYQQQAVRTASPAQLVDKLYGIGVAAAEAGDGDRVRRALVELMAALDLERGGAVAEGLHGLYTFSLKAVAEGDLATVAEILGGLRGAWREATLPLPVAA